MQIRTKVNVTHVDPAKVATGGTKEGTITMTIGGRLFVEQPDGKQQIEAEYRYSDDEGNILPTSNGNKLVLNGDLNGTSIDAISASLENTSDSFSEHFRKDVLAYAISEMANLFGLTVDDIEIV
jgi:hypothetical protein